MILYVVLLLCVYGLSLLEFGWVYVFVLCFMVLFGGSFCLCLGLVIVYILIVIDYVDAFCFS